MSARLLSLLLWSLAIGAVVGAIHAEAHHDVPTAKALCIAAALLGGAGTLLDLARKVAGR
jgi:hypothetical protein